MAIDVDTSVSTVHAERLLRFVLAAAFSMVAFRALADTPGPQAPLELTAANLESVVDPLMAEWIDKHRGPGAVVVGVTRDAQIFARGYGLADIEAKKPFTADATVVRPGSISKLFTGIAVMQLVDQGKFDLDHDVNDYIDFAIATPEGGVAVTLRRLLTHRAGFEEHARGLYARDREPEPLGRWLAQNLPRRLFPNGNVEAYSNYGAALAGYIVERISGEPNANYIQRHILDPLGMRHSTFQQPLPDDLAPLLARGYGRPDQPPLAFFETINAAPAGALSATADDMGRFIRALINGGDLDGVRILSKARLDETMAPSSATPAGYLGLAFFGTKVAGHDAIGHGGANMAFSSDLQIFPAQGIGIFVSLNGRGEIQSARDMEEMIARRLLPSAEDTADAPTAGFPGDAAVAGIYQSSRRAESSLLRLNALLRQLVVKGALCPRVARRLRRNFCFMGRRHVLAKWHRQPVVACPSQPDCGQQRDDRVVLRHVPDRGNNLGLLNTKYGRFRHRPSDSATDAGRARPQLLRLCPVWVQTRMWRRIRRESVRPQNNGHRSRRAKLMIYPQNACPISARVLVRCPAASDSARSFPQQEHRRRSRPR
jgi:CubicO group peptidase (beta-lactamase class C family)